MKRKTATKPAPRYAIVVTWQSIKVEAKYGFIQAFTSHESEDLSELAHIGGRHVLVAGATRVGQRVNLVTGVAA